MWLWVLAAIAVAWMVSYAGGGSKTALPHAFYVPVIVAAICFGSRSVLVVAVLAGVAAGPLLPLDVGAGSPQLAGNWLARMAAFVLIGLLTAYLSRHSLPSLSRELAARRFRSEVDEALDDGQFRLEYQPIVNLTSGAIAGVEALIRWDHPERGVISPVEFIAEAERTGCVGVLTRFVLDEACRQAGEWRHTLLGQQSTFKLAVNISAHDLTDPSLCNHITAALQRDRIPNEWLHLEITETAVVTDVDATVDGLMAMRLLGIRLAIDDFGTGESSLGNLHRFPVDVVKLDRMFIDHLEHHRRVRTLTEGVIALSHAMGFVTVAEGIETPVQARAVQGLQCRLGQGYLFSRPLRPDDMSAILAAPDRFQTANLAHLATPRASRPPVPGVSAHLRLDDRGITRVSGPDVG